MRTRRFSKAGSAACCPRSSVIFIEIQLELQPAQSPAGGRKCFCQSGADTLGQDIRRRSCRRQEDEFCPAPMSRSDTRAQPAVRCVPVCALVAFVGVFELSGADAHARFDADRLGRLAGDELWKQEEWSCVSRLVCPARKRLRVLSISIELQSKEEDKKLLYTEITIMIVSCV